MKTRISIAALLAAAVLFLAGCQSSTALSQEQPNKVASAPQLTAQQAQAIALEHAGFTADAVSQLQVRKDIDDGIDHFDVEFRQGDYEYDYEIHGETSKILSREKDYEPILIEPVVTEPAPTEPAATEPAKPKEQDKSTETSKTITKDEAKKIALNHAKLTEDQVSRLRVELDKDDGRTYYEVDFRHGGYEYDYKISATSGKIVEWDKELDD